MKRILRIICTVIALLMLLAVPVLAQDWFAEIQLQETAGTNYAMFPARTPFNTTWNIDHGYLTSTALDSRIRSNGTTYRHMMADDKLMFSRELSAYASNPLFFYTGMVALDSFNIIVGYDGYYWASDHATMELGNDFSLYWGDTWVDTVAGGDKELVSKLRSFAVDVSDSTDGQINVNMVGVGTDCLDFVRVNSDWVRIPDDDAFSFTDGAGTDEPFTIIAWVNFDDATSSSIFCKWLAAGNLDEYQFFTTGADLLEFSLWLNDGTANIHARSLAVTGDQGTWHHYAGTYDGSELNTGLEVYRDGVNATNVQGGAGVYTGMTNGTEVPNIGSYQNGTGQWMDGLMAEIKVYSAELTPAEILADFNGDHRYADLVAWWKIDEGAGLPQDSSGNGHHATLNLADWVDTFPYHTTTMTYASNVATGEHDIQVAIEEEPAMSLWAADVTVGVSMGQGILPVKLIEEQTLTAPAGSVTFSNIDTNVALWDSLVGVTSRHLVVMVNTASTSAVGSRRINFEFNGDGGANYNYQALYGNGAVPFGEVNAGQVAAFMGYISGTTYANAFSGGILLIPHAFNTSNHKATLSFVGSAEDRVGLFANRWADTDAIDTIRLFPDADNFVSGSTFILGVIDERYLVEEDINPVADFLPDFNNIPQTGDDLVVIGYVRSDRANPSDSQFITINGDAAHGNYFCQYVRGIAAGTSAANQNNRDIGEYPADTADANVFGSFVMSFSQYAEGANDPHYLVLEGYHDSATARALAYSGRRNNVAAITRIQCAWAGGVNSMAGSLYSLYRVPRYVIDRQELTAGAPTITFNNIPQNYQALQLNIYARSDDAIPISDEVVITINTDGVDANFDNQELEGTGGGPATATRISGLAGSRVIMLIPAAGEGANEFSGGVVTFNQYTNTLGHKHFITLSGTNENQVILRSSRWENAAAITRIDLDPVNGVNFIAGSVFELVGLMPTEVLDITVDGEVKGLADGNFSAVDSATDWYFNQDNVEPYSGNFTQTQNDIIHAWYEPNTYISGTTLVDRSYYALNFDGADDNVNRAANVLFDITDKATLAAWVYIDSDGENNEGSIIDRRDAVPDGYRLYVSSEAAGSVAIEAILDYAVQDAYAVTNVDVTISGWHRVVAVLDRLGTDRWEIYVDGVLEGLTTDNDGQGGIVAHTGNAMYIGDNAASNRCFDGRIDEVAFYQRAWAQAEATSDYNAGVGLYTPSDTSSLQWLLHIEEGTGATTADSSGNGLTGTIVAATWLNGHVPRPAGNSGINDGTIVWGSNPVGVSVTMGPLAAYAVPAVVPGELVTPDVAGDLNILWAEGDTAYEGQGNLFYSFAETMATDTNTPIQFFWGVLCLIFILGTMIGVARFAPGNLAGVAFAGVGAMACCIAMAFIPWWFMLIPAAGAIGLMAMERSPSM